MRAIILILVVAFFPLMMLGSERSQVKSVRVTYLANSSFLVKVGDQKILFNGLFQNGMDRYTTPDVNTIYLMKNSLPPFDDVTLVFVSNNQAHQFDPYLALSFMQHNPQARMVCPQQVINKMKLFVEDFDGIQDRLIESTPMKQHYDRMVVGGVEVISANIGHPDRLSDVVENMAFLVNVDGVKLFHSGDTSPKELKKLVGLQLADQDIAIAFMTDIYGLRYYAGLTNRLIDARYNVLMQFEKSVPDRILDNFAFNSKLTKTPLIFKYRNQTVDFYIDDFPQDPSSNPQFLSYFHF